LATALAIGGCAAAMATPAQAAARVAASQQLVELKRDHVARDAPEASASRIVKLAVRRPLTGVRTVLPVLASALDGSGRAWMRVRLPGRPNGRKGWIRAERTRSSSTTWHIAVDLSQRRVSVYRDGRVERRFPAIVGSPATPTPRGRFFVEEAVALSPLDAGGPYALAASARSQVLQEFNGGPGQIAIHGTGNLPGALGTAVSHGCVRLGPATITWLARRVGAGTPLTIQR
jgi:hypothetical protein